MVGFEIFNVFDVQNAITMTWVRDVSNPSHNFGIPNYMTPRVFNIKLNTPFLGVDVFFQHIHKAINVFFSIEFRKG